ncbi:UNVERIFIED_CONTAM: hypothetical protein Sradi_6217100 [Sesamum radiatum]|uniref:Reverse transcriptase zinc-binding domain-containing protein n=1 Tax=Sesamum radiatum TaxID=300843 RepID=A0AAW2KCM8_SESRA
MGREDLARILGIRVEAKHDKYLGMPVVVGRSKREVFLNLKDKVWARLQSWKYKNLSQAGKAILIKSVIQSMPTFVMSCFLIPNSICHEIEECSFTWRSILTACAAILLCYRWQIGDGKTVRVWSDRWIPRPSSFQVTTAPNLLPLDATINTLFGEEGEAWNESLVRELFRPDDVKLILNIPLLSGRPDTLRCHYEKHGRFSVHRAYQLLFQKGGSMVSSSSDSPSWNFSWRAEVRLFAWKLCGDALPSATRLARGGFSTEMGCVWCGENGEDLLHVLLRCHYSRLVWALSDLPSRVLACEHSSPDLWLRDHHRQLEQVGFCRALLICWFLWWARNKFILENISLPADELLDGVLGYEACLQKRFLGAEGREASRQARHRRGFSSGTPLERLLVRHAIGFLDL